MYSPSRMLGYSMPEDWDPVASLPPQEPVRDTGTIIQLSSGDSTSTVPLDSLNSSIPHHGIREPYTGGQLGHSTSSSPFYTRREVAVRQRARSVPLACTNCREVKKKCDIGEPCARCVHAGIAGTCVRPTKKVRVRRTRLPRAPQLALPSVHPVDTQRGAGTFLTSRDHTDYVTHPSRLFAYGEGAASSTVDSPMSLNVDAGPQYYPALQDVVPGAGSGKHGGVTHTALETFPAYMGWPDARAAGPSSHPGQGSFAPADGAATFEPYSSTSSATSTAMSYFHPY